MRRGLGHADHPAPRRARERPGASRAAHAADRAAALTLLLVTLALVTLSVCAAVLTAGRQGGPLRADDRDLFRIALSSASAGTTVLLVLGVLVLTQEYRFGTATPSFLVAPRRGRVPAARLVAVALVGALFAVVSALYAVALALAVLRPTGYEVVLGDDGRRDVGRWLPGGATAAVLRLGDLATTRSDLLPPAGGALLLLAYALGLSVLAARLTLRRDLL